MLIHLQANWHWQMICSHFILKEIDFQLLTQYILQLAKLKAFPPLLHRKLTQPLSQFQVGNKGPKNLSSSRSLCHKSYNSTSLHIVVFLTKISIFKSPPPPVIDLSTKKAQDHFNSKQLKHIQIFSKTSLFSYLNLKKKSILYFNYSLFKNIVLTRKYLMCLFYEPNL